MKEPTANDSWLWFSLSGPNDINFHWLRQIKEAYATAAQLQEDGKFLCESLDAVVPPLVTATDAIIAAHDLMAGVGTGTGWPAQPKAGKRKRPSSK